jgi:hypothetical protein
MVVMGFTLLIVCLCACVRHVCASVCGCVRVCAQSYKYMYRYRDVYHSRQDKTRVIRIIIIINIHHTAIMSTRF